MECESHNAQTLTQTAARAKSLESILQVEFSKSVCRPATVEVGVATTKTPPFSRHGGQTKAKTKFAQRRHASGTRPGRKKKENHNRQTPACRGRASYHRLDRPQFT